MTSNDPIQPATVLPGSVLPQAASPAKKKKSAQMGA